MKCNDMPDIQPNVKGVAPRAKMNQQRARRFRTAAEAMALRQKAEAKGETLPTSDAFDSNCITPGTPFMAKLTEHLTYFINKKITEDRRWRDIQIVLSGHEVSLGRLMGLRLG